MFMFKDINKINSVNDINYARKLKSFSLIINSDEDSRVNYLKINIKLA